MDACSEPPNTAAHQGDHDWRALSQKTWMIVLAGIFMPLLGMILTWLKPGWSTKTKWVATAGMCLMTLAWIGIDKRSGVATKTQTLSEAQEKEWSKKMSEKRSRENIERGRKVWESLK